MVVLDLSRDDALRAYLIAPETMNFTDPAPWMAPLSNLQICHGAMASGTNYSRGDETTLAILFTRCAAEDIIVEPLADVEDTPNDPQD